MATFSPIEESVTSVLTTELNSLASSAASALGTEYDNTDAGGAYFEIAAGELAVNFGSAPTANTECRLYLAIAVDGTNYSDITTGASEEVTGLEYVGSFLVKNATGTQRRALQMPYGRYPLPALKLKFALLNETNQAFPASGSTVKLVMQRVKSA